MFGLFTSVPFHDDALGTFERSGGLWVGALMLAPHGRVTLRLAGDRKAPHPEALAAARALPARYATALPVIAAALFEHLEPYRDAEAPVDDADCDLSTIAAAADVWPRVEVPHVTVDRSVRGFDAEVAPCAVGRGAHAGGTPVGGRVGGALRERLGRVPHVG